MEAVSMGGYALPYRATAEFEVPPPAGNAVKHFCEAFVSDGMVE